MKTTKFQLTKICVMVFLDVIAYVLGQIQPANSGTNTFTFDSTIYDANMIQEASRGESQSPFFVEQKMEGEIRWSINHSGQKDIYLEINKITRDYVTDITKKYALSIEPFLMHITINKEEEPPLKIEILGNQIKSDPILESTQYRTGFLIFEMSLLAFTQEQIKSSSEHGSIIARLPIYEYADIGGVHNQRLSVLKSMANPNIFTAVPVFNEKEITKWELTHWKENDNSMMLYSRTLEPTSKRVIQAINLECVTIERTRKEPFEIMEVYRNPQKFKHFTRHKFILTNK